MVKPERKLEVSVMLGTSSEVAGRARRRGRWIHISRNEALWAITAGGLGALGVVLESGSLFAGGAAMAGIGYEITRGRIKRDRSRSTT